MVNFYIPEFVAFQSVNMRLLELLNTYPQMFYDGVSVKSIYGTFGSCIWNGGRVDIAPAMPKQEMENLINTYNDNFDVALRFTFTNPCLEEKHLSDTYGNLIMELANNGKNEVLVNSPILEEYLREKYPDFKYIASTTKVERDIKEINKMTKKYHLVVTDWRDNNNFEYLDQIEDKNKIELLVNEVCGPKCPRRKEHYNELGLRQLKYEKPGENLCGAQYKGLADTLANNPTSIKVGDMYKKYLERGFFNFKLEGRCIPLSFSILSYAYYMVKPEHFIRFMEMILPIM